MDDAWRETLGRMAALRTKMQELGLLVDLKPGDEYFPDPDDALWNEAIEAAAKVASHYEPRCDVCPSGVTNAILALKRKPSIYQGPVVATAAKYEGGA